MNHKRSLTNNWLLFLFGVGAFPTVKIVGYITATELALLVVTPVLMVTQLHLLRRSSIRIFIALGILWLLSAIASDLYRHSTFDQYARGWARVFMLNASLISFYILLAKNPKSYIYFLLGLTISSVLVLYVGRVGRDEYAMLGESEYEATWSTSYVYIALYGSMFFSGLTWNRRPWITTAGLVLIGGVDFVLGSRAFGGVLIMGAATACFLRFNVAAKQILSHALTIKMMVSFGIFAVIASYLVFESYVTLANNGALGEAAREKYDVQSAGRYGLILGGRTNVVGAALALRDSPIIGYGSWAEDQNGYFYRAMEIVGFDPRELTTEEILYGGRIPTHSYLFEAWVEHGLLAAGFWFFTLWFILGFVRRLPFMEPELLAVMCITVWLYVWNIFFSPMGSRPVVGAGLAIMAVLYDRCKFRVNRHPIDFTLTNAMRLILHPGSPIKPANPG
jgi:hypothetical protein